MRYAFIRLVGNETAQIDGVPLRLGDFRLIGRIGEGGMSAVYEAVQQKLNRRVAIKVLANRLAKNEVFLERFKREARAAASINHPGLIQVFDIGEQAGVHYYAMELVDGENLSERLKRDQQIPENEAIEIVIHVAEALEEAHAQSVVHRDIKPENILITAKGQVKLADLGLAKILEEETSMTRTGAGMGSPHFMAPEQAQDACHVDHRVDIYSLGITFLMLLTGRRPYSATSPYLLARAHAEQPLPSGRDLGRELSVDVERLINKMAAKAPGDRYQDYHELLQDLRRVKGDRHVAITPARSDQKIRELFEQMVDSAPSDVSADPADFPRANAAPTNPTLETPERNRWPLIGLGLAAVLAVVFAVQKLKRSAATPPEAAVTNSIPETNLLIAKAESHRTSNPAPVRPPWSTRNGKPEADDRPGVPDLPDSIIGILIPSMQESVVYYLPMENPILISPRNLNGPAGVSGAQLMKRASSHAAEHPTDYRVNLLNFVAAHRQAPNLQMRKHALSKVNEWAEILEREARHEMNRFAWDMLVLLEEDKPAAAYNVWRRFPVDLSLYKLQPEIYDLIGANIPPKFLGGDYGITPIRNMRPNQVRQQFPKPKFRGYRRPIVRPQARLPN